MLLVSYDISNNKVRGKFSKMLTRNGAIRLQFSVYEINNTERIINNIKIEIEFHFSKLFTPEDSVMIFEAQNKQIIKYGNAIHRDKDVLFF